MTHGIGERIKRAREAAHLSQEQLAKMVGVAQQTLQKLESEPARGTKHVNRFARALGQDAAWLEDNIGEMRPPVEGSISARELSTHDAQQTAREVADPSAERRLVQVVAATQSNVWHKRVEWDPRDRYEISLPIPTIYHGFPVIGFAVRGPSMDRLYPHGSIVIGISYMDLGREPRHSEKVVARLTRGGEHALIAREFHVDRDGKARLWPRSTHPDLQQPLLIEGGGDVAVTVTHHIIAVYRIEF